MRIHLAFFLWLLPGLVRADFNQYLNDLAVQKREMEKLIKSAQECLPSTSGDQKKLCSGVTFSKNDFESFRTLDFKTCWTKIQQSGYKPFYDDDKNISDTYPDFISSTQLAQTLHAEKVVLFKRRLTNRIDCMHELIHIYQQDPKLTIALSPKQREKRQEKFLQVLELAVNEVEKAEKQKKIKEAEALADKLAPYFQTIQVWKDMDDWLDEKDDHYFIYKNCKELGCTDLDKDIALTNLYKRKDFIRAKERIQIERDVATLLKAKEKAAIFLVKKSWKGIGESENDIPKLFSKSWEDLLSMMRAENIHLFKVKGLELDALKKHAIPESILKTLPDAKNIIDEKSKMNQGEALAKFVCNKEHAIILSSSATKGSLIHEYLHHLQTLRNPTYCDALNLGKRITDDFTNGKVTRATFEAEALKANALMWVAELEVYGSLLKHSSLMPKIEHLNNQELYNVYKEKLGESP